MLNSRWFVIAILFLVRTVIGFQFQSVASVAPNLITDFNIDYTQVGTLIGFYYLPGVLLSFPAGLFVKHLGEKTVCTGGLVLMIVGGVWMGLSDGMTMALTGRALTGVGSVLLSQALTNMVTDWFIRREIVAAMGILLASWPFGIVLGLLLQEPLAHDFGWRSVMHAAALLCGMALLLLLTTYTSPPAEAGKAAATGPVKKRRQTLPPLRQTLAVTMAGAMWGSLNLSLVIFFSFGPPALREQGVGTVAAAAMTSSTLWILMFSVPLGGALIQSSGRSNTAIIVFSIAAGLALALLPVTRLPLAFCAALGLAGGPPAGSIMALPSRVLGQEYRALGFGLFFTIYYLILAFGSTLAGLVRDFFGTSASAIFFGAILLFALVPLLGLFRLLEVAGFTDARP
jgi:predicted MFS family arabinose efflux permease